MPHERISQSCLTASYLPFALWFVVVWGACVLPVGVSQRGGDHSDVFEQAGSRCTAGGMQTLAFVIVKANKQSCTVRWSFTPQSNKTYVINGGALGSGCTASLLDASNPDRMRIPDGLLRRNAPGVFCVPLAQATAIKGGDSRGGQSDGAAVLNPGATADDLQGLIGK